MENEEVNDLYGELGMSGEKAVQVIMDTSKKFKIVNVVAGLSLDDDGGVDDLISHQIAVTKDMKADDVAYGYHNLLRKVIVVKDFNDNKIVLPFTYMRLTKEESLEIDGRLVHYFRFKDSFHHMYFEIWFADKEEKEGIEE